jgi:peptidoglycan-N-acetylglucosamine deacetylase
MNVPASALDATDDTVFLDRKNRRWVWVQRVFFMGLFVFLVSLTSLCISIVINPSLPLLRLGSNRDSRVNENDQPAGKNEVAANEPEQPLRAGRDGVVQQSDQNQLRRLRHLKPGDLAGRWRPNISSNKPLSMAFVVTSDSASTNVLKEKLDQLDVVLPEWLRMLPDGTIEILNPSEQTGVVGWFASSSCKPTLIPVITSHSAYGIGSQGGDITLPLTDSARAFIITELVKYANKISADGLCVGLEKIVAGQKSSYLAFLRELADTLHSKQKVLYVCLPAGLERSEYRRVAQIADMSIIMAFKRPSGGSPGPLASQDWFEETVRWQAAAIPQDRLVVAFGNYAGDWSMASNDVEAVSFDRVMETAQHYDATITTDRASLNPHFSYRADDGWRHEVWMLDAVTAFNQLVVAKGSGARGFALWRLGSDDPTLWNFFGGTNTVGSQAWQILSEISKKEGICYRGAGEIIRITATPRAGKRSIGYDHKRGLINMSRYERLPAQYIVQRYGSAPKKIALTFDDGPDDKYTAPILDVLTKMDVPATFFVLGRKGELYPELLRRIYKEGHEIGLHTFTHPNISRISPRQLQREMAASQRLIESVVGHDTLLFRPPYGEDTDPSTTEEIMSLGVVNDLGYWTVGMHIDPDDWRSPPAETIVSRVVEQVAEGLGSIVLLHDSGGDRSQTVAALPEIINQLRERNYKFVTVSELMGSSRDEVMPAISGPHRIAAFLNRLMFAIAGTTVRGLEILFKLAIVLGLARLVFIGLLAILDFSRQRRVHHSCDYKPTVAVIVPGYNEEKVICKTIASLLKSSYPHGMEIIVVDDGSKDSTYAKACDKFDRHPKVRIFRKENGGKSSALNFGISQTNAEIIVAMDADTIFAHDTVWNLVRHFENERVGAVAGNAKVGNRINMLTRWQALEYIASQNMDRRAYNVLNCITVVPGAVGAWRRELIVKAGGFRQATLAEDADLTMVIRRMGYSIVNDSEAYAYTEAPDTLRGFLRQRYRWMYGTLQAAWKHKKALFNPRYGALGLVALPNIILFQIFFPFISPVIDLFTLYSGVLCARSAMLGIAGANEMLLMVLGYFLLFTLTDVTVVLLAFAMEPKEDKKLLWSLIPQRFVYRQLMYYVAVKSALSALRGIEVQWGYIKRKATVKITG